MIAGQARRVIRRTGAVALAGHRARPPRRRAGRIGADREAGRRLPALPAGRILSQLAPDEARILRLLALHGPQPSIDVRAGLPLISSLVAPGPQHDRRRGGLPLPDRVPSYLNNLYRLGLIWFSREPLSDRLRYQVLEAQPDVVGG